MNISESKVLIIDDDEMILKVMGICLVEAGFDEENISKARDRTTAINAAKKEIFSIIVADANLWNGVDGIQVANEIKKNYGKESTIIIGHAWCKEDIMKTLKEKKTIDTYIIKPPILKDIKKVFQELWEIK